MNLSTGRLVGRGGVAVSTSGLRGVDGCALVGHLSHEAVVVVGGVGGGLDTAVGESDGERTGNLALGILGLGLLEVGLGVVIGHAVLVGIGLGRELLHGLVGRGGVVGGGGAVGRGPVGSNDREQSGGDQKLRKRRSALKCAALVVSPQSRGQDKCARHIIVHISAMLQ